MNEKFTDVSFKQLPQDEECILTAVKIGELIDEPAHTVRKWAEFHEDNLYIKKINGRFVYTTKSVEQFKIIKDLVRNKHMTHEQVRKFMFDGSDVLKDSLIKKDPLGYEALSTAITIENRKQMEVFMNSLVEWHENALCDLRDKLRADITTEVEEVVDESLKALREDNRDYIEQLSKSVEKIKEEAENMNKSIGYVTEQQLKQYNNRGLINKIKNLFK